MTVTDTSFSICFLCQPWGLLQESHARGTHTFHMFIITRQDIKRSAPLHAEDSMYVTSYWPEPLMSVLLDIEQAASEGKL